MQHATLALRGLVGSSGRGASLLFVVALALLLVPGTAQAQGTCSNTGAACTSDVECMDLCENKVCLTGGMSCDIDDDCPPEVGCSGMCSISGAFCSGPSGQESQCDGPGICSFPGETCYRTNLVLGTENNPDTIVRVELEWSTNAPIGWFQDQLVSLKMKLVANISKGGQRAKGAEAVIYTDDMIINSIGQPLGGKERPVTDNPGDTGIFLLVNTSDGTMGELQSITGINPMVETTGEQYRVSLSTGTLNIQRWVDGVNIYNTVDTLQLNSSEVDWDCDGVFDNPLPASVSVSTPQFSDVGETIGIDVLVTAAEGQPQGDVRFFGDELSARFVPLEFNGEASTSVTYQEWGPRIIEAEYGGSWRYQLDLGITQHSVRVPTTTTLVPSDFEFPENSQVAITVTVLSEDDQMVGGTVRLLDNGVPIFNGSLLGGQVVFNPIFSGGFHSLTAEYLGSNLNGPSVSPSVLVIGQFATTTSINSLPNPSQFQQQVTLFAAVDSNTPKAPEGVVEFRDNGVPLGQRVLLGGEITLMTTDLGGGTRNVTAHYLGEDIWAPSDSPGIQHEVTPIDTTTDLTSDPNPSVSGEPVTFTAFVTPTAKVREAMEKGTAFMAFRDGNTLLGAAPLDEFFEASITTSALPVGQRRIRAEWGGDPGLNPSVSAEIDHEVLARTVTIALADPFPVLTNEPVTVTATVTSNAGTPTGTVRFVPGGNATLDASGQASVELTFASAQQDIVIAFYEGDGNRAPSEGIALVDVVEPTVMVSLQASPDFTGTEPLNNVDLIATVTGTVPGDITYTFYCDKGDDDPTVTQPFDFQTTSPDVIFSTKPLFDCDYPTHGIYYPKVIAERGVGGNRRAAAAFTPVTVLGKPSARFSQSTISPDTTSDVTFFSTASGPNLTHKWDFNGDGLTDSSALSPKFRFKRGGQERVKLTVSNSYGSSDFFRTFTVRDTTPHITSIIPEFQGFFIENDGLIDSRDDMPLENELEITADWKGQAPGTVEVKINGGPAQIAMLDPNGKYYYTVDMTTLPARFAPTTVELTPVTPGGFRGNSRTQKIYVFPWPEWMEEFELVLPGEWLTVNTGPGTVKVDFDIRFPPEPQIEENSITIPGIVPYVGGKCGIKESFAKISGFVDSKGEAELSLYGQTGVDCAKGEVKGSIMGTGNFRLGPPKGIELRSTTFNLMLEGTIKREKRINELLPGFSKAEKIPVVGNTIKKIGRTGLEIGITPSVDLTAVFTQNRKTEELEFTSGEGTFGLAVSASTEVDLGKIAVEVSLTLGGDVTLEVPPDPDLFTEATITVTAEAGLEVDVIFVPSAEGKAVFECKWQGPLPGTVGCSVDASFSVSKGGMRQRTPATVTLSLIPRDYERHGEYAKFAPRPAMRSKSSLLPETTLSNTVSENIFPNADPKLTELDGGDLLLMWLHDDEPDPIQQCTEVRWSRYNATIGTWSNPQDIVDDTQFEQEIRTGVDDQGRVVAVWRRIKDPNFDPPPVQMEELVTWLQNYEVVTSTFNPASSSWSPVVALTDDLRWDSDLRVATSPSGDLLLTWLSSNGSDLISTGDDPATLHWTTWNSGSSSWNSVQTLATGLAGVDGHTSAYRGSEAVVMLSRDPDIDAEESVPADEVIEYWQWNGSSWTGPTTFAAGGGGHTRPRVQYDSFGNAQVIWLHSQEVEEIIDEGEPPILVVESELVMATLNDTTPVPVRPGSSDISFLEADFMSNNDGNLTLLWQRVPEDGTPAELHALIYDDEAGMWSADRMLTDEAEREASQSSAFYGADGVLRGAYISREIERQGPEQLVICDCSHDPQLGCQTDEECGEGNTCLAPKCSHDPQLGCQTDDDCGDGNTCLLTLNTCETVTVVSPPVRGQADLRTFAHSLVRDLAVFDKDLVLERFYTDLDDQGAEVQAMTIVQFPEPGDQLRATIPVRNTGDFVMENFDVGLFLGDPSSGGMLVDTVTVNEPVAAATGREVSFDFTWPEENADIYVLVDPDDEITELTRVNNQAVKIQDNEPPIAIALSEFETSFDPPETFFFDGSASSDPEGGKLQYMWFFGDGSPAASGAIVEHQFLTPGEYEVTLIVTDPTGREAIDTILISIGPLNSGAITDQLRVHKQIDGDLRLFWGDSCATTDTDFAIYRGTIGDFSSHISEDAVTCSTEGFTETQVIPRDGSSYFLVVPRTTQSEGSYGLAELVGGPVEREPSMQCVDSQLLAVCPVP